ncbi:DUF1684 domain-containing protein [Streptosporangium fragile]|uniref:DUF1684 domain-containing protein n=1 Tax=Streptosporangium fragile TaxID=46186 RepID=A0ABP6IDK8_9ACTN
MSATAPASVVESARAGWDAWRASRLASVAAPTGNLALVETRWAPPGEEEPVGEAPAGQPDGVTVTGLERRDIVTGQVQRGIRRWDANSPAIRHFATIDAFPFDPRWVVEAVFTPVSESRVFPFEHIRDGGATRDLVVPGDLAVTLDGVPYTLSAFDDGGSLLLVFADPTNGVSTYGAGRFLLVRRPAGEERVVLDFNRAFVPPCGFSAHYNCPLPPPQNRLHLPVEAGEKLPVFRDGYQVH